jgi:nitrogen fixation protein NifU and related proteins
VTIPLDEIYQEVILDHNRNPRNFGELDTKTHHSHGINPLCGDDYILSLRVDAKGHLIEARFKGHGCAISKASASMLTEAIEGKSISEIHLIAQRFIEMCTRGCVQVKHEQQILGDLEIFEGVRKFPIRVKCATLIWHALQDALGLRENKHNGGHHDG